MGVLELARNWWVVALRGVAAIVFGILAMLWPGITLAVLVIFYGAYALVGGIFAVMAAFMGGGAGRWWALLLNGILGIAVGIITFAYPGITELALLYVVAAWAFLTGVCEIVAAIQLRKVIVGEFWLILSGLISIVLSVFLIARPVAGLVAIAWTIGLMSILVGITLLALGFRLRAWHQRSLAGGA